MHTSPQLFAILAALVEERVGLSYRVNDSSLFLDRVTTRAIDAGFDSLLDYYYHLRYDASSQGEVDELIEALLVHETYFCRELEPLQVLVDDILVPRVAAGRRPRVWSAACSTGEEPLTLAMLLAERKLLDRVDIVATDISRRTLARAKEGRFSLRSVRTEPMPALVARWLTEDAGRLVCDPTLIRAVTWSRLNLTDRAAITALGAFDAIVCRNVLIYFSDATARGVVASLTDALVPEGSLLVGVSESLLRFGTALVCRERRGVFMYEKPARPDGTR